MNDVSARNDVFQDMDKRPCPFCRGADLYLEVGPSDEEGFPVQVICNTCGARGPERYTIDTVEVAKTVDDWNTLAGVDIASEVKRVCDSYSLLRDAIDKNHPAH